MSFSRRKFLTTTALGTLGIAADAQQPPQELQRRKQMQASADPMLSPPKTPVILCKPTGNQSLEHAYKMLRDGEDTLEACIYVGQVQEDDPEDDSVGYGGLPNEEGVVELDSCCMHGPTRRAGSVASLRNTKHAARLGREVMDHTGHVMLVAEGAERFAFAMGHPKENMLTDRSRRIWLMWKEYHSNQDWWGPGVADPNWKDPKTPGAGTLPIQSRIERLEQLAADFGIAETFRTQAALRVLFPPTGTIHISAVNTKGEMSGCTTTSGLAWKIPGRVGDSPIIGAGCYTDQDVGSAGATGSGEENIKVAGAHSIVENMRHGMSPRDAGLDVLRRIARNFNNDMNKLRYIDMVYYILRRDGEYAGVCLWSGPPDQPRRFAVCDGKGRRLENAVPLFQGSSIDFPPIPRLPQEKR
jgi:N4-(beta-N-acetylglucosaminyl)-L-asparaginase